MTRLLVVNADDLGLSDGVNAGILHAARHGIVTSASLMVRAEAAEDAARVCARGAADRLMNSMPSSFMRIAERAMRNSITPLMPSPE